MNRFKNTLCTFGFLCLGAASLVHGDVLTKDLARCDGLFLLKNDTRELDGTFCQVSDTGHIGKYSTFATFTRYNFGGLWKDGWELSFKSSNTLGSAAVQADFKNIAFSFKASSLPALASGITVHTADSSMFASALLERGLPTLARIRWESENDSDEVHLIDANWKSDYLRKGFTLGSKLSNDFAYAHAEQIGTTPHNVEKEHFFKDSSNIWLWDAQYGHRFSNSQIALYYAGIQADINIFGNTYRDNSTKRFMYIPLEGSLHYGKLQWENPVFGLQAQGAKADIRMEKNNKRFFETLAPNRLLPTSLTQTLSFSFMQKNYLIDADLDLSAVTLGGHFAPQFGLSPHVKLIPRFVLDGYYTYNEIAIGKTSETTSFISYKAKNEDWSWMLESYGLIAGLGFSIERNTQGALRSVSLTGNARQLIPLKTDFIERGSAKTDDGKPSGTKNAGFKSGGIFQSAFTFDLGIAIQF